tara:strand:+ start:356 stop:571 length:216 start_codon:yes stop_codon:yes gene_type:complete
MLKINYLIVMIILLSHCSIDTKSGMWENKNSNDDKREITEINFDSDLSFEDFNKNVVLYGKKSKYPYLMEK